MRGFTALAERLEPAAVAVELNRFYEIASRAIFLHDGTLDKLVGDQVMAFFGAPIERPDHAELAVKAVLEIFDAMTAGASDNLRLGAGVSTGEAFVGNVGGGQVTDYTVLGDMVNVAARLQGEAAAGEILLTRATYARVAKQFPGAVRRELMLKGKSEAVTAWQIVRTV